MAMRASRLELEGPRWNSSSLESGYSECGDSVMSECSEGEGLITGLFLAFFSRQELVKSTLSVTYCSTPSYRERGLNYITKYCT